MKTNTNILIVESENDQHFVEAVVKFMNMQYPLTSTALCEIDDYDCLRGLSEGKLIIELRSAGQNFGKNIVPGFKIGILIDVDNAGKTERLAMVSRAVKEAFGVTVNFNESGKFYNLRYKDTDIKIACELMNVNGKGELETVLKAIKKKESKYADCLDTWRKCLENSSKEIKDKDFDKYWISVYQRFDCCTKKEKKQAEKNCDNETSYNKNIYDFDHDLLKNLRAFLTNLSDSN